MPTGLKTASNTSCVRAMPLAMARLQSEEVATYVDNLIVFGKDLEEYAKHFNTVLQRLENANLKIEPKKC